MNNLLLLLMFLLLTFNSDAQNEMIGKKYKTDIFIGHPERNAKKSNITLSDLVAKDPWGYFVTFNADGTFISYNQVSCGLDCRMKITGTYTLENSSIKIVVNSIKYYDICITKPSEDRTFTYGEFTINVNDNEIVLVNS